MTERIFSPSKDTPSAAELGLVSLEALDQGPEKIVTKEAKQQLGQVAIEQAQKSNFEQLDQQSLEISLPRAILSSFEAINCLNLVRNNNLYINRDEAVFLFELPYHNDSTANQILYLRQVSNRVENRLTNKKMVEKPATAYQLDRLKHGLKVNYIMPLNNLLRERIEKRDHEMSLGDYKQLLADSLEQARNDYPVELYDDQMAEDKLEEILFTAITGIRNELGFKKIVEAMNDPTLELQETSDFEDSKGADLFIKAKINPGPNGDYRFATKEEIKVNQFEEFNLPVDIKTSQRSAEDEANFRLSRHRVRDYALWSHLYKEDFELSYIDGLPVQNRIKSKASVFLGDEQLAAMTRIDQVHIPYFMRNEKFFPENLLNRQKGIKKEILIGIQAIKNSQNKLRNAEGSVA